MKDRHCREKKSERRIRGLMNIFKPGRLKAERRTSGPWAVWGEYWSYDGWWGARVSGSMLWAPQCGTGERKMTNEHWGLAPSCSLPFQSTPIIFRASRADVCAEKKPYLHHPQCVISAWATWERLTWLAYPRPSFSCPQEERLAGRLDWTDMFISSEWCPWMGLAAARPFVTAKWKARAEQVIFHWQTAGQPLAALFSDVRLENCWITQFFITIPKYIGQTLFMVCTLPWKYYGTYPKTCHSLKFLGVQCKHHK